MKKKLGLVTIMLLVGFLSATFSYSQAATISTCTFDKNEYYPGYSGLITVTIFNDKSEEIRVTQLTAKIDYFYTDGAKYIQTFATNDTLPIEILPGNTHTLHIPFELPTNIAAGYIVVEVNAKTEVWNAITERWVASDTATYRPTLYVESPYKQLFEQEQAQNLQLQEQIDDLQKQVNDLETANNNLTIILYVLGIFVAALVIVVVFLAMILRKFKAVPAPSPAA